MMPLNAALMTHSVFSPSLGLQQKSEALAKNLQDDLGSPITAINPTAACKVVKKNKKNSRTIIETNVYYKAGLIQKLVLILFEGIHSLVHEEYRGIWPSRLQVLHGVPLIDAALLRANAALVV